MKLNKIYLGVLLLVLSTSSCKKYLSVAPDNRTEVNTVDKIRELLTTAYPQGNWVPVAESMSDNADDKGEGFATIYLGLQRAYNFEDFNDNDQDSPNYYWNSCYEAIAAANQALKSIGEMPKPETLKSERAEALLCRAYAHLMLVTLYAKPYNEATSATDLGVPYVTEVENVVNKQYKRGTVAKVYEMIDKDIQEALPNLDDSRYKIPKYHFTKAAAYALASRFYLYKKDYPKVVEYANQVLGDNFDVANLRPWSTKFAKASYFDIIQDFTRSTSPYNLLLVENATIWPRSYATSRFGFTEAVRVGDIKHVGITPTRNVTGNQAWSYRIFRYSENERFYPKFKEYFYAPEDPRFGYIYLMTPLFTLEEVLFNRAEAYAYLGNNAASLVDINKFASQRFDNFNATNHSVTLDKAKAYYNETEDKAALIRTILAFRRAEFLHEGMRWLDILRYNLPVTHYFKNNAGVESGVKNLEANDLRKQWQLPDQVVSAGLELNPR